MLHIVPCFLRATSRTKIENLFQKTLDKLLLVGYYTPCNEQMFKTEYVLPPPLSTLHTILFSGGWVVLPLLPLPAAVGGMKKSP